MVTSDGDPESFFSIETKPSLQKVLDLPDWHSPIETHCGEELPISSTAIFTGFPVGELMLSVCHILADTRNFLKEP